MTDRLVQHENPEARETPLLLLADLRAFDPTVELVYIGERKWWLGSVRPNKARTVQGQRILEQMDRLDAVHHQRFTIRANILLGRLLVQGFARIEQYLDRGDVAGTVTVEYTDEGGHPASYDTTVVADFRERCHHNLTDGGEARVRERMAATNREHIKQRADAEFQDYLVNDGRAHYRREVRGRVVFGPGGMTGGANRIILP